ncbi:MAG: hypothetical protein M9894_32740 [Planctomycetes bacterium]|nr:hypothetical protein [Planctomycetota bacterium]
MSRRGGHSLLELQVSVTLFMVLCLTLLADTGRLARQHQELAGHADDLGAATAACDALAGEVRRGRALVAASPDRAVRLGARALVTRAHDGAVVALSLEGDGPRRALVWRRWDPRGRLVATERLGALGDLTLRFDAGRPADVRAVTIDVALPARGGPAAPPVLSTRALVGGEVGP